MARLSTGVLSLSYSPRGFARVHGPIGGARLTSAMRDSVGRGKTVRALEGIRVLVVDNDLDNAELLQVWLRTEGAEVSVAGDARAAREIVRAVALDVLISDIGLPEEDGCALVASLRFDPRTSRLPAIAVTGYSDKSSLRRAKEAGFNPRFVKPVDFTALTSAIKALAYEYRSIQLH